MQVNHCGFPRHASGLRQYQAGSLLALVVEPAPSLLPDSAEALQLALGAPVNPD